jgi:phospholipid/cholesterol/gamma-HCH transport system substrate-binding protein
VVTGRRSVAVLVVLAFVAAGLTACSSGGLKLTAYFNDTGDLQTRGSVQMADVRIGTISKITLAPDFRSKVVMTVKSGVRIPKNSQAQLQDTSLLGEKFVALVPNGDPNQGPFLRSADTIDQTSKAPELEFVAQSAIELLSAVNTTSIATLVNTGAQVVAGRGPELTSLIRDLNSVSATLASRTTQIGQVIDNLDHATQTLAAGAPDLSSLLVNLSQTTQILSKNRDQVVTDLAALTKLAQAGDYSLQKYGADIDREIRQIDVITGSLANAQGQVANLIDWLQRFVVAAPKVVGNDPAGTVSCPTPNRCTGWAQVYMWAVPYLYPAAAVNR